MSVSVRPQRTQRGRLAPASFAPFAEAPAAEFYFPSATHEEAIARLSFLAEEHDRCGVLFGAPGTGKSITLMRLHQLLKRSGWNSTRIDLAGLDHTTLLHQLALGLGTNPASDAEPIELWEQIEQTISAAHRTQQPRVLLLDHADRLRPGAVSLIEHLLHLPHSHGLVTLFAGYREATPLMKVIGERTGLRIELQPLSAEDTGLYVDQMLDRAAVSNCHFTRDAIQLIARISQGVPRRINRLCRAVLLAAKTDYRTEADSELVLAVTEELLDAEVLS